MFGSGFSSAASAPPTRKGHDSGWAAPGRFPLAWRASATRTLRAALKLIPISAANARTALLMSGAKRTVVGFSAMQRCYNEYI